MNIRNILKKSFLTRNMYSYAANYRKQKIRDNNFSFKGEFRDRSRHKDKMCMVLAGYKEFLYPVIFKRLKAYAPEDIDICIISSGKFSKTLDDICNENNWSYLSTEENNVSLVQNVAINLHPNAKYIYKLDEDIFITEGFFENLYCTMEQAKGEKVNPGFIAPLIPINGYGHVRILEKLGKVNEYEKKFGKLKMTAGPTSQIESNPEVAKYFWGEGGLIPKIDEMNRIFSSETNDYRLCAVRFSIGAILMERDLWEKMGAFRVYRSGAHMGRDEAQICTYCMMEFRPMIVSENCVVGHLSFGGQNASMKDYFENNISQFDI